MFKVMKYKYIPSKKRKKITKTVMSYIKKLIQ